MKPLPILALVLASVVSLSAQPRSDIAPARMQEMRDRIQTAAERIAADYGQPSFSMIVSNEGPKAEWIRQRLNALRKADVTEAGLRDAEARLAAVLMDANAKEMAVAQTTARLKAVEIELAQARAQLTSIAPVEPSTEEQSSEISAPAHTDATPAHPRNIEPSTAVSPSGIDDALARELDLR